jgi:hypothetical protein
MSDDAKPRTDLDPAAQVAQELRARLRALPPDQIVDLCAQLLNTYVVEGVVPLARAGEAADLAADTTGEESFAQLLKRLKASRKDPVLERFLVDGENISVRVDGYGVLPITEYRRPTAPPGAPALSRRESVPGAAASIYNRALYQPDQAPTRGPQPAPQSPPQQQRPAQPPAPSPQPGQPAKKDDQQKDRFTLIELE